MQEHERIGQYEIIAQIGKGGMATVYKAYHDRLDRYVAIKVMHTALMGDDSFLARFEREAKIVAKLDHKNIVPIYDYSEKDGSPYLVMKYIDGFTLKQRAVKTGLTLEETFVLMTDIADGLDYAHRQGVLHRDLKPSNILLDLENRPYLTDFGLARMTQIGESTISHDMMLGTPFYISPEQAQGSKNLTPATDIYSFGIILYELITGTVPFAAESAYAIVHGHIYKEVPLPSSVNPKLPRAVDEVLLTALSKTPEDRYHTASELMQAFGQAISVNRPAVQQSQVPSSETVQLTNTVAPQIPAMPAIPDMPKPNFQFSATGEVGGKKGQVEASIDLKDVNWRQVGDRIKSGVINIASMIEEAADSELQKRQGLSSNSVEEQVRKRVEKRHKARQEFVGHLGTYILVNVMLWAFFFLITGSFPFWMVFVTGGWGIGVFSHWWEYYNKFGPGAAQRNREIQAEVERELEMSGAKPKNKEKNSLSLEELSNDDAMGVRLTEDGELTDSFVEDTKEARRRSYR